MNKPVIGITSVHKESYGNNQLAFNYSSAVEWAGGIPLVIPSLEDRDNIKELVSFFDGLLLSGGGDPDPCIFGQEPFPQQGEIEPHRDKLELLLVEESLKRDLPLLGICRGMQVINIAAGGTLYQDLRQRKNRLKHMQQAPRWYSTHKVSLARESKLAFIMGMEVFRVNSFHHQAVARVAPGFTASAYAQDGVVEALEHPGKNFVLGVQWHPEAMWSRDKNMLKLFEHLIAASQSPPS